MDNFSWIDHSYRSICDFGGREDDEDGIAVGVVRRADCFDPGHRSQAGTGGPARKHKLNDKYSW